MSVTWSFGSTDLSTYGVITKMDDYMDLPARRGQNVQIPFKDGTVFVRKFYDERRITFGISILSTSATAQDTLIDSMKTKFSLGTQQVLSCTREDSTVRTANATVDVPMQIQRVTPTFALAVLEFVLSDPYFRLSTAIADNTLTIDASPKSMTVTNPGSVQERNPTILLTGPLTNPTIVNTSITPAPTVHYTGAISAGHTVTIVQDSFGQWTATHSVSGNVIGNVTHSGDSAFLPINPGSNSLLVYSDVTTTGTVKISFYAPFL